jgi:hypothetical protein
MGEYVTCAIPEVAITLGRVALKELEDEVLCKNIDGGKTNA